MLIRFIVNIIGLAYWFLSTSDRYREMAPCKRHPTPFSTRSIPKFPYKFSTKITLVSCMMQYAYTL